MTKNIALYLDGTWNDAESRTNVRVLYEQTRGAKISPSAKQDRRNRTQIEKAQQLRYYDRGVGTRLFNLLRGGVYGRGVRKNIGQAYDALARHYQPGDQIYIFGFSRGAYCARTLAGMLNQYRLSDEIAGEQLALHYLRHHNTDSSNQPSSCCCSEQLLEVITEKKAFTPTPIRFLGVWDTVISVGNVYRPTRWQEQVETEPENNAGNYYNQFHNTHVCANVEHAAHALALDEFRLHFSHTPWTATDQQTPSVKQHWFVGAHANIGGGYRDNYLNRTPRYWIQQQAQDYGLKYHRMLTPPTHALIEPVKDSYAEFLAGAYKRLNHRHIRQPRLGDDTLEVLDSSVKTYIDANKIYRPVNIASDLLD